MKFEMLFRKISVGGVEVRNRIVMPAMHLNYTLGGEVNERLVAFYLARAQGGAGLITVGGCSIDQRGSIPTHIGCHEDRFIPGLAELCSKLHKNDVRLAAQLYHGGRYTPSFLSGLKPVSASPIASKLTGEEPEELTKEGIKKVIDDFAAAAVRLKKAGFDFVEVIASAGYLIGQFLSPLTNRRTDEYGGSIENRMRFGVSVFTAVREAAAPLPVLARIAGSDFMPGGCTNREAALFCAELYRAGVAGFNVTGGWHETKVPQITGNVPAGAYRYLALGVKRAVKGVVIASNRISTPELAEATLREGWADMASMGRALIADPDLPRKALSGEPVRPCIACNQECFDHIFEGGAVGCTVNPEAGRETEMKIRRAAVPRKVLITGAGPAGMEAARVAALRGHEVTLVEKEPEIGGQLNVAAKVPGKRDYGRLVRYYEELLPRLGVNIRGNAPAAADVMINATGAKPCHPPVPGLSNPHVLQAWEVLDGKAVAPFGKIAVLGGGSTGCETALKLVLDGTIDGETLRFLLFFGAEDAGTLKSLVTQGSREVTVVEQLSSVARDMGRSTRWVLLSELRTLGVKIETGTKAVEITEKGILVEKDGTLRLIECDCVVVSCGVRSEPGLEGAAAIGDAAKPGNLPQAILSGYEEAQKI